MGMLPAAIAIARHHVARADEADAAPVARLYRPRIELSDQDWTQLEKRRAERRRASRRSFLIVAGGVIGMLLISLLLAMAMRHAGIVPHR